MFDQLDLHVTPVENLSRFFDDELIAKYTSGSVPKAAPEAPAKPKKGAEKGFQSKAMVQVRVAKQVEEEFLADKAKSQAVIEVPAMPEQKPVLKGKRHAKERGTPSKVSANRPGKGHQARIRQVHNNLAMVERNLSELFNRTQGLIHETMEMALLERHADLDQIETRIDGIVKMLGISDRFLDTLNSLSAPAAKA